MGSGAVTNTPPPPPGFVPLNSAAPPPPPGFVPMERGMMGEVGRQLGLTGRALAGGAAQAVEPFTEPVRYLLNKALPGNPVGNIEAATDQALTQIGVPEPEGALERGVQSVSRFAAGMGGGFGGARAAEQGLESALGLTKQAKIDAPTTEQLKEIANTAYRAADDAGLVIHPGSFKHFAERIAGITKQAGIDRDIHPKATAAVRRILEAAEDAKPAKAADFRKVARGGGDADQLRIEKLIAEGKPIQPADLEILRNVKGKPIKLEDIEVLRRVVGGARGSLDADERRIGKLIANELDDYIGRMGSNDVIAGDPKAASAALKTARDAWTRMSKSSVIEEAVEKAGVRAGQFSGSGFENALRTQFRQIAMNTKKMRGFSQAEQAAIKKVAMGGPLDNAMRMLGKLAPTNVVGATLGGGAGYVAGGPAGTLAAWGAGIGGRRAATALTNRNVQNVSDMVRRGGPAPKDAPEWLLPWLSGGIFGADTQE